MRCAAAVVLAWLLWTAGDTARAQTETVQRQRGGDAGAQLLSIVGLTITPDITASRLVPNGPDNRDDERIDTLRLANDVTIATAEGPLYLEGNLGFARARVDLRFGDRVFEANNFDAVGAFGAVGPEFALGRFTRLRPLVIFGMGYVDDDFGLPDIIAGEPEETLDLRQWSAAYGFGLGMAYERPLGDDVLDVRLKVSQVFFETLWSADPRLTSVTSNRTINASGVYKYDTGLRLARHPLLLTGLLGANAFLGDQQDALGFAWFAEYGAGVELDLSGGGGAVQRARVRVTGIAGDGVTGISFGAGIGF
jgi:hypothetical protein